MKKLVVVAFLSCLSFFTLNSFAADQAVNFYITNGAKEYQNATVNFYAMDAKKPEQGEQYICAIPPRSGFCKGAITAFTVGTAVIIHAAPAVVPSNLKDGFGGYVSKVPLKLSEDNGVSFTVGSEGTFAPSTTPN